MPRKGQALTAAQRIAKMREARAAARLPCDGLSKSEKDTKEARRLRELAISHRASAKFFLGMALEETDVIARAKHCASAKMFERMAQEAESIRTSG